jgi:hypothetical protein
LVAAREFRFAGVKYGPGDPFPGKAVDATTISRRHIERQYNTFAVNHAEAEGPAGAADDPISMTGPSGGRYTISAPWLEKPLVIRGKVNAEKALADLREEGAPLGWIEGGSEVEVEEAGGGWFHISAPWLDEDEKVQGREAAEARQREIHDAGPPADVDDQTGAEGAGDDDDGQDGGDDNSDKSESEQADGDDAGEGSGTDDAEQAEGAGGAGDGTDAADDAEAGESNDDDPADA